MRFVRIRYAAAAVMALAVSAAPAQMSESVPQLEVAPKTSALRAEPKPSATPWRAVPVAESRAVGEEPRETAGLNQLVAGAVRAAIEANPELNITEENVYFAVIDARDSRDPRMGAFNAGERVYPASLVKVCYMVAAYDWNRRGLLELDGEVMEDIQEMIGPSSNVTTSTTLDRLSNTSYGPELEDEEALNSFQRKRLLVTNYMNDLGYDMLAQNKTYGAGVPLSGRSAQILGERKEMGETPAGGSYTRSNRMTADGTARLMYTIWRRALVDREACEAMLDHMRRGEDRDSTYLSALTPEGGTYYSKSGATGWTRHDAGIFELPEGGAIVVAAFSVFPEGEANAAIIQDATETILARLRATPPEIDNATAEDDPALAPPE